MSEATTTDSAAESSNLRFEMTDEDRRNSALHHAISIHGHGADPRSIISSAELFAAFLKGS